METQVRGRHRLGGKHSDPIIVPKTTKPRGKHAALPVPPKPEYQPTIHKQPQPQESQVQVQSIESPELLRYPILPAPSYNPEDVTTGSIKIVKHKKPYTTLAAIATGGMLIVGAGNVGAASSNHVTRAGASTTKNPSDLEREQKVDDGKAEITADTDVVISQPKVTVETIAAPPKVVVTPIPKPEPAVVAPAVVPVAQPKVVAEPIVSPVAAAPVISNSKAETIYLAALGQLGVYQDCTRLATNALAAAGVYFHGWPWEYAPAVGHYIPAAEAIPGDLIYYVNGGAGVGHIAVYAGNGMAVHGGYNGNETRLWTAYVGSGPQFIRVH